MIFFQCFKCLDSRLDKISNFKASPCALGNYNCHFLLFPDTKQLIDNDNNNWLQP